MTPSQASYAAAVNALNEAIEAGRPCEELDALSAARDVAYNEMLEANEAPMPARQPRRSRIGRR